MAVTTMSAEMQEFFALFGAERRPDPYPHYRQWRERLPVALLAERMYAVSGITEATQVLRDPAFGHPEPEYLDPADRLPDQPVDESGRVVRAFLSVNPPDHTRLRRLVAKAFTPRMSTSWRRGSRRSPRSCSAACGASST